MIIDSHTHIFSQETLEQYKSKSPADICMCIKFFQGYCGGMFEGRDQGLYQFVESNENVYLVESIDFEVNILQQLDEIDKRMKGTNKIKGIKLYPGYQHFYPYDERILSVYVFAQEHNIPVIIHSGFLYSYQDSQALLKFVNPIYIDEAATRYPETDIVLTHFGFPYLLETATLLNKNNNVYADFAGIVDDDTYDVLLGDMRKALKYFSGINNQILFGTDFVGDDTYLNEAGLYLKFVDELFSEEDRNKVLYETAKKVFRI